MAAPIITVERLGKRFTLRHQQPERYTALRDVMADKVKGIFRGRTATTTEEFRALDDVSFTVNAGDRVGIIGRNGAGKSTLLKILSRITPPSSGRVTIDGRVASLLEVGTGFHPELTGRENIFLNGAILGMSRAEIAAKFDEIVAFAEVERFLDTPVKRYSSGMYVRLAFAVAAHLEPEILIVDEVLAVGDAAFQRKCLGKMESVSGEGRTVLFVSHNMEAVQKLCNRGVLLAQGRLVTTGPMNEVIDRYVSENTRRESIVQFAMPDDGANRPGVALSAWVVAEGGAVMNEVPAGRGWELHVRFRMDQPLDALVIGAGIVTAMGLPLRTVWSAPTPVQHGLHTAIFRFHDIHFASGLYHLVIGLSHEGTTFHQVHDAVSLHISEAADLSALDRVVNTRSGLILDQCPVIIERA
jgi:lipopolysaccharide transport system ATP-binding protein